MGGFTPPDLILAWVFLWRFPSTYPFPVSAKGCATLPPLPLKHSLSPLPHLADRKRVPCIEKGGTSFI